MAQESPIKLLRSALQSFDCGSDIVLFCENSGGLFLLNETAGHIWRLLGAGDTPDSIISRIAARTGISPDRVSRDVEALIAHWQALAAATSPAVERSDDVRPIEGLDERIEPMGARALPHKGHYRILNFEFEIRTQFRQDFETVEALFGHLSTPCLEGPTVFDIIKGPVQRRILLKNGQPVGVCDSVTGLGPLLHATILMTAYGGVDCLAGVHAAVVAATSRAILMPGESGSGKSTLTAALVAAGYTYCTDDLAILTLPPVRIRPVPVGIGLKQGSWTPLAAGIPALADLVTHVRGDGKRIRYFLPPRSQIASHEARYTAHAILFPCFSPDARISCERISAGDALLRLTHAGYDARLSSAVVAMLVEWLSDVPAYELRYASLKEAVTAVEDLMR